MEEERAAFRNRKNFRRRFIGLFLVSTYIPVGIALFELSHNNIISSTVLGLGIFVFLTIGFVVSVLITRVSEKKYPRKLVQTNTNTSQN